MMHNDRPRSSEILPFPQEAAMILGRSRPHRADGDPKPECRDEPPCRCVDVRPCPDMPGQKPVCVEQWTCTCENQDPPSSCACEGDFTSF